MWHYWRGEGSLGDPSPSAYLEALQYATLIPVFSMTRWEKKGIEEVLAQEVHITSTNFHLAGIQFHSLKGGWEVSTLCSGKKKSSMYLEWVTPVAPLLPDLTLKNSGKYVYLKGKKQKKASDLAFFSQVSWRHVIESNQLKYMHACLLAHIQDC